jgi:hypothetical protein
MKPGYKSTEFWLTVVAQVFGLVLLFGVLTAEQSATLYDAIARIVEAVVALAAALVPLIEYIKARTGLKALE